jgi:16S rRNA (guanine1207-N2)-methyltransferase
VSERSLWLRALSALAIAPGARLLALCMADEPVLLRLRDRGAEVAACDWHWAALERAVEAGLPRPAALAWAGGDPPVPLRSWDVALCDLAHLAGRAAFAEAVRGAVAALRPGGRLFVRGGNAEGVGGAARLLRDWLGAAEPVAYGGGGRILAAEVRPGAQVPAAPEPPWTEVALAGVPLRLRPAEAVFARGLPDAATQLLAEALAGWGDVARAAHACDVGAGGGALGLFAAARGAAQCTCVDENLRAVAACRANAAANGLAARVTAVAGDAARSVPGGPYPLVACNPPFHRGPREDRALGRAVVRAAWAATAPGGSLFVVCSRFLRYEHEVPALAEVARSNAFRVLAAARR